MICVTLVPIANNTLIEVWVQGEKIEGQWKFDDGTPIPNFCPIFPGTNPEEIRIRARGSTSFVCWDNLNIALFHYSCEYPVNWINKLYITLCAYHVLLNTYFNKQKYLNFSSRWLFSKRFIIVMCFKQLCVDIKIRCVRNELIGHI